MGNVSGNAYALTILSPIKNGYTSDEIAYADLIRDRLQGWNTEENSPMSKVPQTYLCRYFVLDDVYTESYPGAGALPKEDHLKSRYLVFSCNFHGGPKADLDGYLRGMWNAIGERVKEIWGYCYGFEQVDTADKFIAYMKKCQLKANLFFVGSTDDSLDEQLKSLYLKQEFAKFAIDNQGFDASTLKINFQAFIARVKPTDLCEPIWTPGKYRL